MAMSIDASLTDPDEAASSPALDAAIERELVVALRGLSFGQITIVVHEGAIVQIDRLERRRLRPVIDLATP
jgi:hypothetical protein